MKTSERVSTGYVYHMNAQERKALVLALRDFERELAGPGNDEIYYAARALRKRVDADEEQVLSQ